MVASERVLLAVCLLLGLGACGTDEETETTFAPFHPCLENGWASEVKLINTACGAELRASHGTENCSIREPTYQGECGHSPECVVYEVNMSPGPTCEARLWFPGGYGDESYGYDFVKKNCPVDSDYQFAVEGPAVIDAGCASD